ncbi:MAG: hypothetical protein H6684_10580 [Deltaproteobacteria bacterium]|nr:hypothetical protein [bacterium]MCB9479164.1 hypothetical protein [Deltaproteobacteria bacterium]MCB9489165.1 hypothetical protein [Deltaproteobacteria bacterium]
MPRLLIIAALLIVAVTACDESSGNDPIGAPCDEKDECDSGLCIQEERYDEFTGFTGGICTQYCAGSCPGDAVCQDAGAGEGLCHAACDTTDDCRDGYACTTDTGACVPDCRLSSCGDTAVCVEDTGLCAPDCRVDGECEAGLVCGDDGLCQTEDGNPPPEAGNAP